MTFDPQLPVWLIAVLLIALLIYSMIIEWRRPLRFLLLRLISCVVAIASLAFILLKPSFRSTVDHEVVLLTDGFSQQIADSLRRVFPHATFYHLGETGTRYSIKLSSYRDLFNGTTVGNKATVAASAGTIRAIAGNGLPAYALDSIHGGYLYFPSGEVDGITSIAMPSQRLTAHQVAVLGGTFHNGVAGKTLYLSGPGGKVDSLRLSSSTGTFSFAFTPRTSGRVTYSLSIKDSLNTLTDDEVPMFIDPFVPLNILMLQDFPTFEMQHLKNFLSDRGHKIAMRAQLSKNIVRTEFANREAISLARLTVPLLDGFDLLIVDPSTLAKLSAPEREAVSASLNNGLGIIAVFNGEPSRVLPKELVPITFAGVASDTSSVLLNGKRFTLPATRLKPTSFEGVVVSSDASRVLSGYTPVRKGMAGFQLLRETYSILMAGDSLAYGLLWSPLLEATARSGGSRGSIRLKNAFPAYANDPLYFDVIGGTTPTLFADSVQVPAAEDVLIDDIWHATAWEEHKGWHELRTEEDSLSYFVFNNDDWKALRVSEQKQATYRASLRPAPSGIERLENKPVPLAPIFITFLVAVGFLWLAPKL
ncbi:MAG: hypothetical protein QM762_11790 [Chryseolinea sp.]